MQAVQLHATLCIRPYGPVDLQHQDLMERKKCAINTLYKASNAPHVHCYAMQPRTALAAHTTSTALLHK
jgi:hypothetical protein